MAGEGSGVLAAVTAAKFRVSFPKKTKPTQPPLKKSAPAFLEEKEKKMGKK